MAVNKSKADLITQAATTLADNTTQAISPQDVREMAENLAESNFNKTTDNALVGLKAYDTGVIYKVSQGVNYNGSLYFANKDTTPGVFNTADWDLFAEQSNVIISGKKASAGTIAKGKPVYLVGFDSDLHTVEEANATAAGTTPVIGFTAEAFNASSSKSIITFGKLTGIDTSSFSVGNDLYLATSAGGLTTTRPTGGSSIIQRIAKVLKSHASTGEILIYNTARAAGLPNIAQNHVWIGDANGQPQAVNKSTLAPSDGAIETAYNNQVPAVTQSEAEAGTVTTIKRWTPERIKQAIDALAGSGAATVYTSDGTIGAGRVATLTNNFTIKNGTLKVEGIDTASGNSALQIYNGDTTPALLWDFRNNGDVIHKNGIIHIDTVSNATSDRLDLFNRLYIGELSGTALVVEPRGAASRIRLQGNLDLQGVVELGNGYGLQTEGSSMGNLKKLNTDFFGFTNYNDTVEIAGLKDSILTQYFWNKALKIGTNHMTGITSGVTLDVDGKTTIKGADTLGTSSALQIYDGDSTPAVLWDFKNNGDLTGNKAKIELTAQNTISNDITESVFLIEKLTGANLINIANDGYFHLGDANSINGLGGVNLDFSTCFQVGHNNSISANNGSSKLNIGINNSNTSTSINQVSVGIGNTISGGFADVLVFGLGNTGRGRDNIIVGQYINGGTGKYVAAVGNGLTFGGEGSSAIASLSNITSNYSGALGFALESSAIGAFVIGYGSSADFTQKLVNNTANSLALGWNTTTPTYLFASTGATVKVPLDMDNNRITNAVLNPSVQEAANSATFTINADQQSDGVLTAMSAATTIAAPTGTPVQSQSLVFRFTDDGTARAITWNAIFRAIGVTLPTTTTANKLLYVGCKYNSTNTKWDVVSVQEEA